MKGRWIALGIGIGVALTLTLGFAFASGSRAAGTAWPSSPQEATNWWEAMDRMHDSPWMQQMHAQMPGQFQEQCNVMHEQMEKYLEGSGAGDAGYAGGGMMGGYGGSGMMGGSGGGMMGAAWDR